MIESDIKQRNNIWNGHVACTQNHEMNIIISYKISQTERVWEPQEWNTIISMDMHTQTVKMCRMKF